MLKNLVLIVAASISLAGCDDRECVRSHTEERLVTMPSGKGTILVPMDVTVCDEWKERTRG